MYQSARWAGKWIGKYKFEWPLEYAVYRNMSSFYTKIIVRTLEAHSIHTGNVRTGSSIDPKLCGKPQEWGFNMPTARVSHVCKIVSKVVSAVIQFTLYRTFSANQTCMLLLMRSLMRCVRSRPWQRASGARSISQFWLLAGYMVELDPRTPQKY